MYPSQLIGKKALRTKEITYSWGAIDRSYMTDPVNILAVTEHHIVIEKPNLFKKEEMNRSVLSYEYIDNNWTSYDDLMSLATLNHIEIMQIVNKIGEENNQ